MLAFIFLGEGESSRSLITQKFGARHFVVGNFISPGGGDSPYERGGDARRLA